MKNSKKMFLLFMMSTACHLFPYAEFELVDDAKSIRSQFKALVSECKTIELREGKKQFDEIRSYYNHVQDRAYDSGSCIRFSDKQKSDIFLGIFKEIDSDYQTLATLAMIADKKCAFCRYATQELKKMEEAELKKNNSSK